MSLHPTQCLSLPSEFSSHMHEVPQACLLSSPCCSACRGMYPRAVGRTSATLRNKQGRVLGLFVKRWVEAADCSPPVPPLSTWDVWRSCSQCAPWTSTPGLRSPGWWGGGRSVGVLGFVRGGGSGSLGSGTSDGSSLGGEGD